MNVVVSFLYFLIYYFLFDIPYFFQYNFLSVSLGYYLLYPDKSGQAFQGN